MTANDDPSDNPLMVPCPVCGIGDRLLPILDDCDRCNGLGYVHMDDLDPAERGAWGMLTSGDWEEGRAAVDEDEPTRLNE